MLHISKSIYRATWPFLDIQDPGMLFPIATPVFSLPLLFVVKSPPTTCCVLELDSVCAFSRDLESPTQTSIYDHLYINYSLPLVYLSSLKDKDSWNHAASLSTQSSAFSSKDSLLYFCATHHTHLGTISCFPALFSSHPSLAQTKRLMKWTVWQC